MQISKVTTSSLAGFLLFLITFQVQARIWKVDNTGSPADFTTLQAAHDSAKVLAGDTLHIMPSLGVYPGMRSKKKLILIGAGYFRGDNFKTTPSVLTSIINGILFENGSEGSVVTGMEINTGVTVAASNISVLRNNFAGAGIFFAANLILQNIIVNGNYAVTLRLSGSGQYVSNVVVSNNLIINCDIPYQFSGTFVNNIFHGSNASFVNSIAKNNIFSLYSGSPKLETNTYINNLDYGTSLPDNLNNKKNVDMAAVFVGTAANSTDGYWQLKENSPAKGAGEGGVDAGMFGGPDPYVLSGMPSIPFFYKLSAPSTTNGNSLNVTFSVKTNK